MKLTTLIFVIALLQASAKGFSQNINLNETGAPLKKILNQINKQTGYVFFYDSKDILNKNITVHVKNASINEALQICLKNLPLTYKIVDKTIILQEDAKVTKGVTTPMSVPINISGRVLDITNQVLTGVTVKLKNGKAVTITDAYGKFNIEVPDNSILVFSFVGYATKELPATPGREMIIYLEPQPSALNEVIVVGYGVQKKATLTGAVSQIKGTELTQSPSTNVSNSLAGRLAGLMAVTPQSEPGADGSILRIRGINTMNNNNPLVVVDGIPGRSLDRIDPSTVESVSVLKDASAAIYGAQAANGVILITTKRGKLGAPTITASINQGLGAPTKLPKMADAATYATMLNEIAYYKNPTAYTPVYTDAEIKKFADGSDPWNYPNTNWFKEVLKPWSAQSYENLSLSGGTESVKYFVSLSGKSQDGFYRHSATNYKQYDFRTNLDAKVNKNINLSFDVAGRMEDRNYATRNSGVIFAMVMRGKPTLPAYWPDGTPGPDIESGDNPVVTSTNATGYDHDKRYVVNSNVKLNIKIPWVNGLSLTANAAVDKNIRFDKIFQTPWYLYTLSGYDANNKPILQRSKRGVDSPNLTERMEDNENILTNGLLNYETTFLKNNHLNFLVGVEKITAKGDFFSAYRKNFTSPILDQMFAGATDQYMTNDGSGSSQARLNYFGRVNYAYKQKYLAEFVWRYQGSYIFPENKRFGFFPGISVGYNISEEDFWKSSLANTVNSLKIRGSWGQTGNDQIPEYQYLALYNIGGTAAHSYNPRISFITNDGVENPALYQTVTANPDVTWEIANQANIGFDATFLNNKLAVTVDFFNYTRSQILWYRNASVPTSSGLDGILPRENIGKMGNKGFDFSIAYNDHVGKLSYQIGLNGGYQKNRIIFWDEPAGAPAYQRSTGHPYDSQLLYNGIGIFHNQQEIDSYPHMPGTVPGDIKFQDYNHDGKIDALDQVRYDKSENPTFQGGFSLNLAYKGFDLAALFQGSAGAVKYITSESGEIGNFKQSDANGRWTPQNPNANKPRTFNRGNEYWVALQNTYWLEKSDYIRLKTIELGYTLPKTIASKLGMQNLRFYVNAYNLLTYCPGMKDFDPELSFTNDNGPSVNTGGQQYPLQKIINCGLSATF